MSYLSIKKLKTLRYSIAQKALPRFKTNKGSAWILQRIVDLDRELLLRGKIVKPLFRNVKLNKNRSGYQSDSGLIQETVKVFSSIVPELLYRSYKNRKNIEKSKKDTPLDFENQPGIPGRFRGRELPERFLQKFEDREMQSDY